MSKITIDTHGELAKLNWSTLSDERAKTVRPNKALYRIALIVTGACNFKCSYCNQLSGSRAPTLRKEQTLALISSLAAKGLKELRISGGEPTVVPWLPVLVEHATALGIRVAVSSNGFAPAEVYRALMDAGVAEFSISLDSADADLADRMSGNQTGVLDKVTGTIKQIADEGKRVYIGMTCCSQDKTTEEMAAVACLADSLGVAEIKIMSLSGNPEIVDVSWVTDELRTKFPLLNWRASNYQRGKDVRGLGAGDCSRCSVVLDDATIAGSKHYPCNVYFREGGAHIGDVSSEMLSDRAKWADAHNSLADPICSKNCMDILREYNNRVAALADSA